MKIKIRQGVFETNSSSTHSICITKSNQNIVLPKEIDFTTGSFGWENKIYSDPQSKASYLYTAILELSKYCMLDKKPCIDFITETLYENNVICTFTEGDYYYIDHCSELVDFVTLVCHSERRLLRYLFSEESFIVTGNDNDDDGIYVDVDYKCEEYYKGN